MRLVEGCITVADNGDLTPEVRVAMHKAALIESAGGTYGYAAMLTGIADMILNYELWSVALAGTPCQMAAYEKMLAVGRGTMPMISRLNDYLERERWYTYC